MELLSVHPALNCRVRGSSGIGLGTFCNACPCTAYNRTRLGAFQEWGLELWRSGLGFRSGLLGVQVLWLTLPGTTSPCFSRQL